MISIAYIAVFNNTMFSVITYVILFDVVGKTLRGMSLNFVFDTRRGFL